MSWNMIIIAESAINNCIHGSIICRRVKPLIGSGILLTRLEPPVTISCILNVRSCPYIGESEANAAVNVGSVLVAVLEAVSVRIEIIRVA